MRDQGSGIERSAAKPRHREAGHRPDDVGVGHRDEREARVGGDERDEYGADEERVGDVLRRDRPEAAE